MIFTAQLSTFEWHLHIVHQILSTFCTHAPPTWSPPPTCTACQPHSQPFLSINIGKTIIYGWGAIKHLCSIAIGQHPDLFRSSLGLCSKPCIRHAWLLSHGPWAVKFYFWVLLLCNPWRPMRAQP